MSKGISDLQAPIEDVTAEADKVYARLKVRGTQKGNLFGMPVTNKCYEVQMCDYARIKDGKIVERIQQSDNLGQFMTLFKTRFITIAGLLILTISRNSKSFIRCSLISGNLLCGQHEC